MTLTQWRRSKYGDYTKRYFYRCCPMLRDFYFYGDRDPDTWDPPTVFAVFVLPPTAEAVPNVLNKDTKGADAKHAGYAQYVFRAEDGTQVVYCRAHKQRGYTVIRVSAPSRQIINNVPASVRKSWVDAHQYGQLCRPTAVPESAKYRYKDRARWIKIRGCSIEEVTQ